MLNVHHLGISQSERIVWLCEELEIPYQLTLYDRDPVTRLAPAAYKALHPMGTAPVITDNGVTLGESGAIIEYIIAKYGDGRLALGSDHPNFADYLFWFHFANGSLMPGQMLELVMSALGQGGDSPLVKSLQARVTNAFKMVEARLGETIYLAGGEFTAADIIALFPLTTMRLFMARDLSPYPNIRAYLARIGARPAYQRAMAKGDPGLKLMLD
jgi:glutathione S-transferase